MKTILDYVLIKHNFLTKEECEKGIKDLEKEEFSPHVFYNAIDNTHVSKSGDQELEINFSNISLRSIIDERLPEAIESYMNTAKTKDYWNRWTGYSSPRFNKYEQNRKMAIHVDHIYSLFSPDDRNTRGIPILSCLSILNDNFTGGEFIMFENTHIKLKQGDLLIFPSNFIYPHRVEPVKTGKRWTAINWVY